MSHRNRLSCSVASAVITTALALLFCKEGGELFTIPGVMIQLFLNVLFMLMNTNDDWYHLPAGSYVVFNVVAYSFVNYILSWLYTGIKEELQRK